MSVTNDQRGVFEANDGNNDLSVVGKANLAIELMVPTVLTGTNFAVLPSAGFYQVPVSGTLSVVGAGFTGSLPSAAVNPGGNLMITDTLGVFSAGYLITGSMAMQSGSLLPTLAQGSAKSINGTKLTVSQGGSVGFWSDGKGWLVCAMSGTLTMAP
jgi:hypothetical protein